MKSNFATVAEHWAEHTGRRQYGNSVQAPAVGLEYAPRAAAVPSGSQFIFNELKEFYHMTYVVTEACIKCKYTDCVDVCPVDCFREGPNFLVIDPDECIDCTLCEPECPVGAIFRDDDLPEGQEEFQEINARLARVWPPIIQKKPAPNDADAWAEMKDKRGLLEE